MKFSEFALLPISAQNILAQLPPDLIHNSSIVTFDPGEIIVMKDTSVSSAFALLEGTAIAYIESYEGKYANWLEMVPLSFISDVEILAEQDKYLTNVSAKTEVTMLKCSASFFKDQLQKDSSLLWNVASKIARNSCRTYGTHGKTVLCSNIEKTSLYLLQLCGEQPPTDQKPLVVQETREQISSTALVPPRTLDRCLQQLEDDNCLSIIHGKIHINAMQYRRLSDNWLVK